MYTSEVDFESWVGPGHLASQVVKMASKNIRISPTIGTGPVTQGIPRDRIWIIRSKRFELRDIHLGAVLDGAGIPRLVKTVKTSLAWSKMVPSSWSAQMKSCDSTCRVLSEHEDILNHPRSRWNSRRENEVGPTCCWKNMFLYAGYMQCTYFICSHLWCNKTYYTFTVYLY